MTRKTANFLENILGKQTFESLQSGELNHHEIELINQNILTVIESKEKYIGKNFSFVNSLNDNKAILLKPELVICSDLILEFLLSQKIAIVSIVEKSVDTSEFLEKYKLKFNQDDNIIKFVPTGIINFMHSPAKIINVKEPLNLASREHIENNISHKQYYLMAEIFGPIITTILNPVKYIQNCYLGL